MANPQGDTNFVPGDLLTASQYNATNNTTNKLAIEDNTRIVFPGDFAPANIAVGHWVLTGTIGDYSNFNGVSSDDVDTPSVLQYNGSSWDVYPMSYSGSIGGIEVYSPALPYVANQYVVYSNSLSSDDSFKESFIYRSNQQTTPGQSPENSQVKWDRQGSYYDDTDVNNHIADSTIHFTEESIEHANIQGIGSNSHAAIDVHIDNAVNPHGITSTDIGLGFVNNTSDDDKPVSIATQDALDLKYDTSNPAGYITTGDLPPQAVTSVFGRSGSILAVSTDYSSFYAEIIHSHLESDITDLDKYTQSETDQLVGAVAVDLISHEASINNPHYVTKDQVGLDQVDNTSDLSKPISAATQSALDLKIGDALSNGLVYARKDGDWTEVDTTDLTIDSALFTPQQSAPAASEGKLYYDEDGHNLKIYNGIEWVEVGDLVFRCTNNTGSLIPKGTPVYVTGVSAEGLTVAPASSKYFSQTRLVAITLCELPDLDTCYCTVYGQVSGVDTSGYSLGDALFLSETPGQLTNVTPSGESFMVIVGYVYNVDPVNGLIGCYPQSSFTSVEVTDTNGFPEDQRSNTEITYVEATRTLSISHTTPGDEFHFYEYGVKFESTGDTANWTDIEGEHWFYYIDGVFTHEYDPTIEKRTSIILNNAFVTAIYWNATDKEIIIDVQDERHGIGMSPQTHLYLHLSSGAKWISGYSLGDFDSDGDGNNNSAAQFSVSDGVFFDEDINHLESGKAVGIGLPIIYNSGSLGDIREISNPGYSIASAPAGRVYYNEWTGTTWQLTEVPDRDACCYHVFGFNGQDVNTVSIMGQAVYANVDAARDGAATEISNLISQLPFAEMIPVGTFVVETRNTYTNDVKGRIRTVDGADYISWTGSEISQGTPPSSHLNLTDVENADLGVTQGHVNSSYPLQLPSLTTTERDAITPIAGMMIYNTTTSSFQRYITSWLDF